MDRREFLGALGATAIGVGGAGGAFGGDGSPRQATLGAGGDAVPDQHELQSEFARQLGRRCQQAYCPGSGPAGDWRTYPSFPLVAHMPALHTDERLLRWPFAEAGVAGFRPSGRDANAARRAPSMSLHIYLPADHLGKYGRRESVLGAVRWLAQATTAEVERDCWRLLASGRAPSWGLEPSPGFRVPITAVVTGGDARAFRRPPADCPELDDWGDRPLPVGFAAAGEVGVRRGDGSFDLLRLLRATRGIMGDACYTRPAHWGKDATAYMNQATFRAASANIGLPSGYSTGLFNGRPGPADPTGWHLCAWDAWTDLAGVPRVRVAPPLPRRPYAKVRTLSGDDADFIAGRARFTSPLPDGRIVVVGSPAPGLPGVVGSYQFVQNRCLPDLAPCPYVTVEPSPAWAGLPAGSLRVAAFHTGGPVLDWPAAVMVWQL